ncbi:transposase [Mycoplasmatota bacterium WC44]
MASKGQKFRKYSLELKFKVIKEKIEDGKSSGYLSRKYEISVNTIKNWVYQYRHGNRFDTKKGRPKNVNINYEEKYEILKKYQTFLKDQRMKRLSSSNMQEKNLDIN